MSQHLVAKASLAIASLLIPCLLLAQQRGAVAPMAPMRMAPAVHPAAVVPQTSHVAPHVVQAPRVGSRPVSTTMLPLRPRSTSRPAGTRPPVHNQAGYGTNSYYGYNGYPPDDDYGVPGLGFDYVHYAAVHPNRGRGHFYGGGVVPFWGGGIYYPSYVEGAPAEQPAADTEQGQGQLEAANPGNGADQGQAEASGEQAPYARPRAKAAALLAPSSEYIFVRRDGTVFFAVAYSWVNGNLQYVTQDGMRKLVSQAVLDLDATQQFNEQRGVIFHSPA